MISPRELTPEVQLRIATLDDAPALADAQIRNWEHLRPFQPDRDERWFTPSGQEQALTRQLERHELGQVMPWVMVSGDRVVGRITLTDLVPGPFRSVSLGYWVATEMTGKGLATRAVEVVAGVADTELKLHRIEASTLTGQRRVAASPSAHRLHPDRLGAELPAHRRRLARPQPLSAHPQRPATRRLTTGADGRQRFDVPKDRRCRHGA